MKKNGALQECYCLCHCASCEHYSYSPCSPAFHALLFFLQFLVSSNFNPCNSFSFSFFFFFVISYTLSTYISLSLYKLKSTHFLHVGNTETGAAVSPLLHFLLFFHFLFHFLGCQHPLMMTNQRMFAKPPLSLKGKATVCRF